MEKQLARYRLSFDTEIFEGHFTSQVFPWHFHDAYTLVLVEAGAVKYQFRDKSVVVGPGQIFVVNPYEAHYNRAANPGGWTYKVLFLPVTLFEGQIHLPAFAKIPLSDPSLYARLIRLHQQLKNAAGRTAHESIVLEVAEQLSQHFPSTNLSLSSDERIRPAIDHICNNPDEKLTIRDLALRCNLSHFHFQRIFKSSTGLTVNAFIHQKRMELSRQLLRSDEKAVNAAMRSGYFDQSHFHHQFKKMYGLTPQAFRRDIRG